MAGGTISIRGKIEDRYPIWANAKRKTMAIEAPIGSYPWLIAVHKRMVPVRQAALLTCRVIVTTPADLLINALQMKHIVVCCRRNVAIMIFPAADIVSEFLANRRSPSCRGEAGKPFIKCDDRTSTVTRVTLERVGNRIKNMTIKAFRSVMQISHTHGMTNITFIHNVAVNKSTTGRVLVKGLRSINQGISMIRDPGCLMGLIRLGRIGIR